MIYRIIEFIRDWLAGKPLLGGLRGPLWNQTKREFEKLHPKICAVCGITKKIELHHCLPYHLDKSKENDFNNLIWLCRLHHLWVGHLGSFFSFNSEVKRDSEFCRKKIAERP